MLKVGILSKTPNLLDDWELMIMHYLLKSDYINLAVIFIDGRVGLENPNNQIIKVWKSVKNQNFFSKLCFRLQLKIEKFIFNTKSFRLRNQIIEKLNKRPFVKLNPKRNGFFDDFPNHDLEIIKNYKLDIILRHEFNIIRGEILKIPKFGIWSFHHADNRVNRGRPPAFWEIFLKQKTIGTTLQKLTNELDGGFVIDRSNYNLHWSVYKSQKIIMENSVALIIKNLRLLNSGEFNIEKSQPYKRKIFKIPSTDIILNYCFRFYTKIIKKFIAKISFFLFGVRPNCWCLFIGDGNFFDAKLNEISPIIPPKNEFWADPFIFKYRERNYIFFENYNYKKKIAKISCGIVSKNKITDVGDALVRDYHLSFPFIFSQKNQIFMIPETMSNNRLEIYKCQKFPNKWDLFATAFDGENVVDPVIFTDKNKKMWLFLNKKNGENGSCNSDLYIYQVDSIKLNKITAHKKNPVITNSLIGRNGGRIFEYENEFYRPSQSNYDGVYGKSLNISKIVSLSLNDYKEKLIRNINPDFKKNLISVHHMDQSSDIFVYDAAFEKI